MSTPSINKMFDLSEYYSNKAEIKVQEEKKEPKTNNKSNIDKINEIEDSLHNYMTKWSKDMYDLKSGQNRKKND